MTTEHGFKIVLLGEGRVGKTSILVRYVDDTYEEGTASTLQASFMEKTLKVGPASERQLVNGGKTETAKLSIWDTAGQERFHALGPIYYRDANGAVLVYDVTDESTFERVKMWTKELRTMVGEEDRISIAIVGNKLDLIASGRTSRRVSTEDAMEYAKSVGAMHFDASAKEGTGVQDAFLQLTRKMIEQRKRDSPDDFVGGDRRLVVLSPEEESEALTQRHNTCC
uniref:Ras-related protein Rab-21 n=1 Tax=Attheya septentrionalis TaxID=420275 RepID=A0A7S2XMX4_9STRA|mmetsp:Transcript_23053/g.41610  ORF Transcript_23053/g.41610 Transcript_23053/m.41610 type:complete len:225 (+) Transcript_23053:157-831(+)|eukprot:CAMPEP_0198293850 /NCGR_PEP_ID=MMETSP1449-20131203/19193_1 /TAXON_ID=420275 /ORGANISM="Attheya septentrionalis, Strain CCMP2084" /LENGTH=224 /DNA_ID=CAMNT_0043993591 /DNA_START=69 /DNA_END=743 /DNA_ORIENTATION=-